MTEKTIEREVAPTEDTALAATVYALQAVSFLLGITYIVAAVLNYGKMESVKGTIQESHFRWQLRTFWYSLLFTVIGIATCPLMIGYPIMAATCVWVIYRIAVGWLALRAGNEVDAAAMA